MTAGRLGESSGRSFTHHVCLSGARAVEPSAGIVSLGWAGLAWVGWIFDDSLSYFYAKKCVVWTIWMCHVLFFWTFREGRSFCALAWFLFG
jgi:hypothetical protein